MERDIIQLDKLGLFATGKCKYCGAGLRPVSDQLNKVICLNACHLGEEGQKKFNAMMQKVVKEMKEENK